MAEMGRRMTAAATTKPGLAHLPFGAPTADVMEIFQRDGGLILDGALTKAEVAQVNADIDVELEALHCGTIKEDEAAQTFWGRRTKRLTNVVTLSRTWRERLIDRDETCGYVAAVFEGVSDAFWLQSSQAIEIHPGERAQPLHRDMANYPVFFRYGASGPEVVCNMILALCHATEPAGATRVIPGSHAWDFAERGARQMTVAAELEPGAVLFYSGKLIHGGGANVTPDVKRRVVSSAFNPCFLVPEEAYPFVVPMDEARKMSPRLQQMIGFRSFHQRHPPGGSLWQHNYEELALHLGL
jgi:ectoine hydroxylase-related dioxygenase (phytanoyl-CoA dioxygenase family)